MTVLRLNCFRSCVVTNNDQTSISSRLQVGDLAPSAQLARTNGECITLADLFHRKRTVLVFLRHFG